MFKNTKLAGTILTLSAFALAGCGHESDGPASSNGGIAPSLSLNTQVISSKASARAGAEITVDDLALSIKSKDGKYSKTWESVAQYSSDEKFPIGQYSVEAHYGALEDEGFEKPYYYGAADVTVAENEVSTVNLTASLANSMVSIDYTDNFKNYMQAWNSQIHSVGGQYVTFVQDETRPAYVRPGEVTLNVSFTKPGAAAPVNLQLAKFDALARHHYHISIDINNGSGVAVLAVVFDELLDQEAVEIELSDELINAPAPTVTPVGFNNGDVINHVAGTQRLEPVKFNIMAKGGLSAVTLTTQSTSLVNKQGWPAEINLIDVDDAVKANMQQLGLKGIGIWKNPEKMAVVDLTDVIGKIEESSEASHFVVCVTDKLGKTSEICSFDVNLEPQQITLSNPSELFIGQNELFVDLGYNGGQAKDVTIEYLNERGTWTSANASASVRARAMETYRMKVTVPADNKDVQLRARTSSKTSDILTVKRQIPAYTASAADNDVWARKAYITVSSDKISSALLAESATVFVSTDGTSFSKANATVTADNKIGVTGLNPATKYTVRVSITDNVEQYAPEFTFTTETDANVPNPGFEDLVQTLSENGLNQGGKWSISAGINYQSTLTYAISEPKGWASVNPKTTSGSTRNSWFVMPSTFNTSLSYSSTVPKIKVIGTGGGTETPGSYKGFSPKSGGNAMVIRNVAWDPAGSVPGTWLKTGISTSEYYNHTVPAVANKSAGKLFLGTYSYSNGNETYNSGYDFASRPEGLSFYYIYKNDANDASENGIATVEVLNGDKVIATGSAKLAANVSYSLATVKLSYIANAPKATSIRVMFSSSDRSDESSIAVSQYLSRYESYFHGATLIVDDLTLSY